MATAPTPGIFLRPRGSYGYTLEVQSVHASQRAAGGLPRVLCRRWGLKDGLPFDDGHLQSGHGLSVRYRAPGVWSSPAWYADRPRYGFVLYQTVPGPNGQMGLFQ